MSTEKWYIKYTPEITEEVFNKLLQALKDKGYSEYYHIGTSSYVNFKNWQYLSNSYIDNQYCTDSHIAYATVQKFPKDFIFEKLILGKFRVGDVVVSLSRFDDRRQTGDIFKVHPKSTSGSLYYKESSCNQDSEEWRLATQEEVQAYNSGITNISDIKPKLTFKAGDWVEILHEGFNSGDGSQKVGDIKKVSKFEDKGNRWYIWFTDDTKGVGDYEGLFRIDKYMKLSSPKSEDLKGRYVKARINNPNGCQRVKQGDIGIITDTTGTVVDFPNQEYCYFPTTHHYADSIELMPEGFKPEESPVDLLTEAKRKYSVGTKYKTVGYGNSTYTVEKQNFSLPRSNEVYGEPGKGTLYLNGIWAEIISQLKTNPMEEILEQAKRDFPVGTKFNNHNLISSVLATNIKICKGNWKIDEDTITVETELNAFTIYKNGNWAKKIEDTETFAESILREAIERYPIGSKYIYLECDKTSNKEDICIVDSKPHIFTPSPLKIEGGRGYLYVDGVWAEKVKEEPVAQVKSVDPLDALLEEAARIYPMGAQYYWMNDEGIVDRNVKCTATKAPRWIIRDKEMDVGDGYCYVKGKWAPLVLDTPDPVVDIPKSISDKYTPKVGDTVEITRGHQNWSSSDMDEFIGKHVVITETYDIHNNPGIRFQGDRRKYWRLKDGHFKPVISLQSNPKKYQFNEQEYLNKDFNKPIILNIKKRKNGKSNIRRKSISIS